MKIALLVVLCALIAAVYGQDCTATRPCPGNNCCSQWGWCGATEIYCGPGCQSGPCLSTATSGTSTTSTSSTSSSTTSSSTTSTSTTSTSSVSGGTTTGNSNTWPNGPVKALYVDSNMNWNTPALTFKAVIDSGYNLVILAFIVTANSAVDAAGLWGGMSGSDQLATIQYAHDRNARIIVSAGGETSHPYASSTGAAFGASVAKWASNNHLDGVDFDLENFGSGFTAAGMNPDTTIQWVADATNTARDVLGANGIITHAPQPPYFGAKANYSDGYTQIYKKAPSINFLLVQYYNNGPATTYDRIFTSTNGGAVAELISYGIPANKIVVGKPVLVGDAGSQYMPASDMATIFRQAERTLGWFGGVMGWQWHSTDINSQWIRTIYPN